MTDTADNVLKVVVLASGSGTLLQAIIDHQGKYQVVGVVADVDCPALERAKKANIPAHKVELLSGGDRGLWNHKLAGVVEKLGAELVVSAGFMKILGVEFLDSFAGRIINTHPALLPSFPGAHAVRDALTYGVITAACCIGPSLRPVIRDAGKPALSALASPTASLGVAPHGRLRPGCIVKALAPQASALQVMDG